MIIASKINPLLTLEYMQRKELQEFCGYKSPSHFRERILTPLLKGEQLALTIPEKPNSPKQKYIRRTALKA